MYFAINDREHQTIDIPVTYSILERRDSVTLNSVRREIVSVLTIVSYDKVIKSEDEIKHSDDFVRSV